MLSKNRLLKIGHRVEIILLKIGGTQRWVWHFIQIDEALDQGVQAVRALVLNGFSQHISRFNMGQKYKYHKV